MLNNNFSCTFSNDVTSKNSCNTENKQKTLKENENIINTSNLNSQNYFLSNTNNLNAFTSDNKCDEYKATDTFPSTSIIPIHESSYKNNTLSQNFYSQSAFNLKKLKCYQGKNKTLDYVDKINVFENPDLSTFDLLEISKITATTNSLDLNVSSTLHNSTGDDIIRSASVKPESNCGGVSSSCYESLSDDSDDYENSNQKNFSITQPSSSKDKTLQKSEHDQSDNESQEGKNDNFNCFLIFFFLEETLYLNVLTMNLPLLDESTLDSDIEQKNIQLNLENTSNLNHENVNVYNEDTGQNLCFKLNDLPTTINASSTTTCIYEPLSDDDIF